MNKIIKYTWIAALASFYGAANADEAQIRKSLAKSMPSIEIKFVEPSVVKGLYEVSTNASIFYISEDGKYLLQGKLIDVAARKDLTEAKLSKTRIIALDKLGEDNMIIFKAPKQKYTVSIFTDIDCGYCRKLHSEMDSYLEKGISIRYLFFPRAGKGSESYEKAVSVWCAKDRNAALTSAKKGESLDKKSCDNPIDKQMDLAHEFGATGTPMIVTEKGMVLPGYLPAEKLIQALKYEQTQ